MSLLMDALKKAEEEKRRSASAAGETGAEEGVASGNNTITLNEPVVPESDLKASANDGSPLNGVSADETIELDSADLALEPLAEDTDSLFKKRDADPDLTQTGTVIGDASLSKLPDATMVSSRRTPAPIVDQDATLPSERSIRSSLREYFDGSQALSHRETGFRDDATKTGPVIPPVTPRVEQGETTAESTTNPRVTAHTVFNASRPIATHTTTYLWASFSLVALLLAGLGLYYFLILAPASVSSSQMSGVAQRSVNSPGVQIPESPVKLPVESQQPSEVAFAGNGASSLPIAPEVEVRELPLTEAPGLVDQPYVDDLVDESIFDTVPEIKPEMIAKPDESRQEPGPRSEKRPEKKLEQKSEQEQAQSERSVAKSSAQQQPVKTTPQPSPKPESQSSPVSTSSTSKPAPQPAPSAEMVVPDGGVMITRSRGQRQQPSSIDAAYRAFMNGNYRAAERGYRAVLALRPTNRDALFGLAALATQKGDSQQAYRYYAQVLRRNPKDSVANAALFNMRHLAGGEVSESRLKMLLDTRPSPQLYFSLGTLYAEQNRWAEAQKAYFQAYSSDSRNPDYAYNLAVSLDNLSHYKSALEYYREALAKGRGRLTNFSTAQVQTRIQTLSSLASAH